MFLCFERKQSAMIQEYLIEIDGSRIEGRGGALMALSPTQRVAQARVAAEVFLFLWDTGPGSGWHGSAVFFALGHL